MLSLSRYLEAKAEKRKTKMRGRLLKARKRSKFDPIRVKRERRYAQ